MNNILHSIMLGIAVARDLGHNWLASILLAIATTIIH